MRMRLIFLGLWGFGFAGSPPCAAQEKAVKYIKKAERRVVAYITSRGTPITQAMRQDGNLFRTGVDEPTNRGSRSGTVVWDSVDECDMLDRRLVFRGKLAFVKDGVAYVRLPSSYRLKDLGDRFLTERDLYNFNSHMAAAEAAQEKLLTPKIGGRRSGGLSPKQKSELKRTVKASRRAARQIKAKAGKRARGAQHLLRVKLGKVGLRDTMPNITVKLLCDVERIEWSPQYLIPTLEINAKFIDVAK